MSLRRRTDRRFGGLALPTIIITMLIGALVPVGATSASAHALNEVTDSTSPTISYTGSWRSTASPSDLGGSIQFLSSSGSAALKFTGTSVTWTSRLTASSGRSAVYIDGVLAKTVDGYSSTTRYAQTVFASAVLPRGEHTISIRHTGTRNAASAGSNVIIDGFAVTDSATNATYAVAEPIVSAPTSTAVPPIGSYENTSKAIVYAGAWSQMNSGSDSGGSSQYLNSLGSASLTFRGTTVRWLSRLTPSSGIADVYLDGVKVASVDRYSSGTSYKKVVFERTGLSNADHTIRVQWTGRANPASTGKNLLLDSFVVPDTTSPPAPGGVVGSTVNGQVLLSWLPSAATDLAGYRIYRLDATGKESLVGSAAKAAVSFTVVGAESNTQLRYVVSAADGAGNQSTRSAVAAVSTTATQAGYRYAGCPAATVTVTSARMLSLEMSRATPGTVIRLAPGTYTGQISVKANGAPGNPIWLCGPRSAIVNVGGIQNNHGIIVSDSSHLVVSGMTVTNGLKGITVRNSHHVTVADTLVNTVGFEAIHLRENTTDSVVIGNVIRNTGLVNGLYGEGIYIGSSDRNWCSLTACLPDRSDRNAVLNNTISMTTAQPIEVKEGTTGGVVRGNVFDGLGAMSRADSWVMVKGNDWTVTSNVGTNSTQHGFHINGSVPGWGLRNLFSDNSAKVDASGFGFKVYEPNGTGTSGTILSCTNTVTGAVSGFAVAACTR